jgi:hypothetical protein
MLARPSAIGQKRSLTAAINTSGWEKKMRTIHTCIAFVLGTVTASGWASPASKDPVFKGTYFYNFENSYLTPEGKDEAWCINSDMSKAMLPPDRRGERWGTSYVVVRGKLGPEGRFGGLGACNRVLKVTEIIEVKNMRGRK